MLRLRLALITAFCALHPAEAHDLWGIANPELNDPELPNYEDLAGDARSLPPGSNARYLIERVLVWQPGSTLRLCFMNGPSIERDRVIAAILAMDLPRHGVNLRIVSTGGCSPGTQDEIRVSFEDGCCAAHIGRASMHPKLRGKPTVFLRPGLPDDVIQHEVMHTFGVHHEHQNPSGVNCYSRLRDVEDYAQSLDWNVEVVRVNMQRFGADQARFAWSEERDEQSITHYQIAADDLQGGRLDPCYVARNRTLSEGDYEGLRFAYPMGVGIGRAVVRAQVGIEELEGRELSSAVSSFLKATASP